MYKLKLNGFETVFQRLKLEFRRRGVEIDGVKEMADFGKQQRQNQKSLRQHD